MTVNTFQRTALGALLVFALVRPATAAEPAPAFSVEALQGVGLEANGLMRAAQAEVRAAEAGIVSAVAYPNPELEILAGQDKARLAGVTAGNRRSLFVRQRIENPMLRGARIGSAEAGAQAARAGLERARADLAAEIRVRAFELLLRQEEARAATDDLNLLDETRRRVKVRVDVGEAARYELIKAESEVLAARSRKEAAQLNVQRARVALVQLAGGALPANFELRASLLDPVQLPALETLRQEALDSNPDLARLEAELQRARLRTDQERAAVLPALELRLGQQQDAELRSNVAGVSASIPLFDWRRGLIAEQVAETERLREMLAFRRFEIGQQIESAWQAKQMAQRKVEMLEGGVVQESESALRVAEAAYRFGERGLLDVLDAQRVLRSARSDLLQARFELQSAAAEIDRIRAQYPKRDKQ